MRKYRALYTVSIFVFVLLHGQSAVERRFSVNKEIMVDNMQQLSLISQRVVYDHFLSQKLKIHELPLSRKLLKSCMVAHQNYLSELRENKSYVKNEELVKKRKLIQDDIVEIKRKKGNTEECISSLAKEADNLSYAAEKYHNLVLLSKSNSFRSKVVEKDKEVEELNKTLKKLEESLKGLK